MGEEGHHVGLRDANSRLRRSMVAALAVAMAAMPTAVGAVAFDIAWSGGGGYSLDGRFTYPDALDGTGVITGADLTSFEFEVFLTGTSLGTWDLFSDGLSAPFLFNFNFDTITAELLTGGTSTSGTGQVWNATSGAATCPNPGVGFSSGQFQQGVCVNGGFAEASVIAVTASTLTATREAPVQVPVPAPLVLLGLGLLGLGAARFIPR